MRLNHGACMDCCRDETIVHEGRVGIEADACTVLLVLPVLRRLRPARRPAAADARFLGGRRRRLRGPRLGGPGA